MKGLKYFINIIITFSMLLIVLVFSTKGVSAEETKKMSIPFIKDYKTAQFQFYFDDEQTHVITITSPDGSVATKESDSTQVLVEINNAVSGTYNIVITAEEPISVNATVEGITGTIKEVGESGISVSSVISGLQKYFIDGDLCLKWEDTGLGKINVKVINPATMQVLANETVNGTFYRLPLANNVENVEIFLVPSAEAKIDGAGVTYTIPVVRDVEGSIEVPDITLTNIETVTFNASFQKDMEVVVTENGDRLINEDYDLGEHEITVDLNGINNDIVVTLIDKETYNQITYSFTIVKDMIAPTLSFNSQYNNLETTENKVIISGIMKSGDYLYVNNISVEYESNGAFEVEVPLSVGENTIAVCAVDEAGNEFPVIYNVYRLEEKKSNAMVYIIASIFVVFVALLIAVIFKVVSMKKNTPSAKEEEKVEKKEIKIEDNSSSKETVKKNNKKEVKKIESSPTSEVYKNFRKKRAIFNFIFDVAPVFVVAAIIIILFVVILQISIVTSGSMEPTMRTGSITFYNKMAYINSEPERGDIIFFNGAPYSQSGNKYLTKRVVGVAGDEITFLNGNVYINGLLAVENYLNDEVETNSSNSFVVPSGSVFVMGDNRENSLDSRFYNSSYVSISDIKGKYFGNIYIDVIGKIVQNRNK